MENLLSQLLLTLPLREAMTSFSAFFLTLSFWQIINSLKLLVVLWMSVLRLITYQEMRVSKISLTYRNFYFSLSIYYFSQVKRGAIKYYLNIQHYKYEQFDVIISHHKCFTSFLMHKNINMSYIIDN